MSNININFIKDLSNIYFNFNNLKLSNPTNISIDSLNYSNNHKINILYLSEPLGVSNISIKNIKNNNKWDYILTWNDDALTLNNSILFEYGTTWVGQKNKDIKKTNLCSIICGDKSWMPGHKKRINVFSKTLNNNEIVKFYSKNSSWKKFKNNKRMFELDVQVNRLLAFHSKFHIVIENCSENSYFSEKIIDCFLTNTIPIYWGAPNINKYFNTKGMLFLDDYKSVTELVNFIKNINIEDYQIYMEENYNKALNWIDLEQRLKNKLIELIGIDNE